MSVTVATYLQQQLLLMPRFECQAPDCEFLIRTRDPDEIVRIATEHAAKYHDKEADPNRIRSRIED